MCCISSRVPDALRHSEAMRSIAVSCRCAEPGPISQKLSVKHGPRLCSAPRREERRAAPRPGNEIADRKASPEQRRTRHESIERCPELRAKSVLLLQDLVPRAGDDEMRTGAQVP